MRMKSRARSSPKCKCRVKEKCNCPFNGKCFCKSVIYKATVTSDNTSKEYIGLGGNTFKGRFSNHSKSFNSSRRSTHRKETALSKYVWSLKDKGKDNVIKSDILRESNRLLRGDQVFETCV